MPWQVAMGAETLGLKALEVDVLEVKAKEPTQSWGRPGQVLTSPVEAVSG